MEPRDQDPFTELRLKELHTQTFQEFLVLDNIVCCGAGTVATADVFGAANRRRNYRSSLLLIELGSFRQSSTALTSTVSISTE